MQAALLPDRGVVKVVGDTARHFLNGLVTGDMAKVAVASPRFAALLTPQGKIIVDFIIAEAPAEDGGGFFLDCPRALAPTLVEKLNFYKLRAKVICEDLSEVLGVMAVWDKAADSEYGLSYPDPRLPALGFAHHAAPASGCRRRSDIGADLGDAGDYETHGMGLGVPRGGWSRSTATRSARSRYGPARWRRLRQGMLCRPGGRLAGRAPRQRPQPRCADCLRRFRANLGLPIMAGAKQVGTLGSTAKGRGLASMRLDRIEDALAAKTTLEAGGVTVRTVKPSWAKFDWPGEAKTVS